MNEKKSASINKMSDFLQDEMKKYLDNNEKLFKDAADFFMIIESITVTFFIRNLYKILFSCHLPKDEIEDYLENVFKKCKKIIIEELERDKETNH
jgi:hypothetical protein